MDVNTILESLYYVASVAWIALCAFCAIRDLWERHKVKDDEGRKKKMGQR